MHLRRGWYVENVPSLVALLHLRDAADVRGHVPSQPVGALSVKLKMFAELNPDDVDVAQQLTDVVTDDLRDLVRGRHVGIQRRLRRRRDRLAGAIDQLVENLVLGPEVVVDRLATKRQLGSNVVEMSRESPSRRRASAPPEVSVRAARRPVCVVGQRRFEQSFPGPSLDVCLTADFTCSQAKTWRDDLR